MDNRQQYLLAAVVVILGVTAVLVMPGSVAEQDAVTFSVYPVAHANVYLWGVHQNDTELPDAVELSEVTAWPDTAEAIRTGQADMADVSWIGLDDALGAGDVGVLPYQVNVPEDSLGIWVRNDSSIDDPADLDGTTIAVPENTSIPSSERATAIILRQEYDINATWVERNTAASAALDTLDEEGIDAVMMTGSNRLGDRKRSWLKPVFRPQPFFEERFGDAAFLQFFVARNDSGTIRTAFETMDVLEGSARQAQREYQAFNNTYWFCTEFLPREDVGVAFEPMTPGFRDAAQYYLDAAHDQGIIDRRIDLEQAMLERPE